MFPASPPQEVVLVAAVQRGLYQCRGGDALQLRQVAGKRRRDRQAAQLQHLQDGLPLCLDARLGPAFRVSRRPARDKALGATLPALGAQQRVVIRPGSGCRPRRLRRTRTGEGRILRKVGRSGLADSSVDDRDVHVLSGTEYYNTYRAGWYVQPEVAVGALLGDWLAVEAFYVPALQFEFGETRTRIRTPHGVTVPEKGPTTE